MAQSEINAVKNTLTQYRQNVDSFHSLWFSAAVTLADEVGISQSMPRICNTQANRTNVPYKDPEEYYRRALTIPFLGKSMNMWKMCPVVLNKCCPQGAPSNLLVEMNIKFLRR